MRRIKLVSTYYIKRELVKLARDVLDLDGQDFKVRDAEDFYKITEVKV